VTGDYLAAQQETLRAGEKFRKLRNAAGEDRAQVERSYALMRASNLAGVIARLTPCWAATRSLHGFRFTG